LGFKLREIEAESKFCRELTLAAVEQAVPLAEVQAVLAETGVCEQRARKLSMLVTVLVTIAMNIYSRASIGEVMRKLAQGLRYIWPDPDYALPNDSAISQRRYQLGARPLVALFHRVCQPLATPATSGAFLFGLRLMAIDGSTENVADTPENVAAFGRFHAARGDSAFPQVQAVYLAECGTHAIVDAGFWPCHTSERVGGLRMLRSLGPGMLVMWDSGFHDFDMVQLAVDRGAHVLARLPAHVKPQLVRRLSDGSYWATIRPSEYARRTRGECLLVRIIEYTITDPNLPHAGEVHRLLTTLLDPERYPAVELACAYHERWEIELVIDETDTHQRLAGRPLRSLKPVGVIQELYALLIAHYAIRYLMHAAAVQADLDPDRLSFTQALAIVQAAIPEFQMTAPDRLPKLYARMLHDLAARPLPERRLRTNPRVVKRKMSNFKLKRAEHFGWPQPSARSFREAVALI
jgi:Insertion element 4 transposase N-terminal/Transposase DDE domain